MGGEQKRIDCFDCSLSLRCIKPLAQFQFIPTSNHTAWNSIEKWAQDIAVATFHAKDEIEVYEVG